ncbi:MAG TPA: DUF2610 domain-containing protein [Leptolyngbyaceae cyanobacterium M65_K2018_010]|nr:DUF2610 domain-containing protein [Leptolyngbyaceae cyanobacterium M65_K2018_010]
MATDVFISYSRRDKEFVEVLYDALQASQYGTWIDWQDIAPTTEWWKEIEAGIEAAHTFIFVISPDSVASEYCRQEIDHAVQHGKRLIPILRRSEFERDDLHPKLGQHQWLMFRAEDDFDTAFATLVETINTDIDHKKTHTQLQVRAIEWQQQGRDGSLLLRGRNLEKAEQWLLQAAGKEPPPTPLQGDYIAASRRASTLRQRGLVGALGSLLALALTAGGLAFWQFGEARRALVIVEEQKEAAERARNAEADQRQIAEEKQREAEAALALAEAARKETIQALTQAESAKEAAEVAERQAEQGRQTAETAKQQALEAQQAEVAQRQTAEQQRQAAEKNLAQMTQLVDGVSDLFQGHQGINVRVVGFAPIQRNLFEFFLPYHEYIIQSSGQSVNSWRSAEARFRIGQSSETIGDSKRAEHEYRLAFFETKAIVESSATSSKAPSNVIRLLNQTAVFYAWNRMNYGYLDEAGDILILASKLTEPHRDSQDPELIISFSNLENALARLFSDKRIHERAKEHQLLSIELARKAVSLAPENVVYKRNLATYLRNLSTTPEALMAKEERDRYALEGCGIAREADLANDAGVTLLTINIDCAYAGSLDAGHEKTFEVLLDSKEKLNFVIRLDPENIEFKLSRALVHTRLMRVEQFHQKDSAAAKRYFYLALNDWLAVIGDGKTLPNDVWRLRNIYDELRDFLSVQSIDATSGDTDSPEVVWSETERQEVLEQIVTAIERTLYEFNDASQVALIAADSMALLASFQKDSSPQKSLVNLNKAIDAFQKSGVFKDFHVYDERYTWACGTYEARLSIHVDRKDVNLALADLEAIQQYCQPIFKKYDFDFYLLAKIWSAHDKIGELLFNEGRFLEAKPILEFSSYWGRRQSTELLSRIYREGLGVPVNFAQAEDLETLASKQSMKRFTIPADFGSSGRHPFHFYVYQKPDDYPYKGIDDQAEWLKQARGGTIPEDVIESFRKLHQIAVENDVSFPELAAYAVGRANPDAEE